MYMWNYIQDCHGKSCIQQEEDSFYQQIGLKFEEESNKMLHLERDGAYLSAISGIFVKVESKSY